MSTTFAMDGLAPQLELHGKVRDLYRQLRQQSWGWRKGGPVLGLEEGADRCSFLLSR